MVGIYKITNIINNKSYIGQSVHIERRWSEHCFPSSTSMISLAIKKYGKENFNFEVIELCDIKDLNDKEKYWISYFNSIIPNGYNISEDTDTTHTSYIYISKDIVMNIINDLKSTQMTFQEIANKYNINISNVSRINSGKTHIQENLIYPIRKTNYSYKNNKYCIDCGKILSSGAQFRCINCEHKHQKEQSKINKPVNRNELKNLIRNESFVQIGKRFNVSDNAIRKWCKLFELPYTKKEINSYSEEEWKNI